MRVSTGLEYPKLVRHVERSLRALGYPYLRNETDWLTEFQVLPPCHFRVVVENNSREAYGLLGSKKKTETSLELRRELEARESESQVARHAAVFMERLTSGLPPKPWKGLGMIRSRTERAKWSEMAEI